MSDTIEKRNIYKSDRIKIDSDIHNLGLKAYYKVKFFPFIYKWKFCGKFYNEEKALAAASAMWFLDKYSTGGSKNGHIKVVCEDGDYVIKKRFLKFFWRNVSNKRHNTCSDAWSEVGYYYAPKIDADVTKDKCNKKGCCK